MRARLIVQEGAWRSEPIFDLVHCEPVSRFKMFMGAWEDLSAGGGSRHEPRSMQDV